MSSLGPDRKLPSVGSTVGKYHLERVLGRGAMAIVYQATHVRLRQSVAIKLLMPAVCDIPDTVKRFEREARAAVQLRGPNVARVLDVDSTDNGLPYIVMEYLDGHDLAAEMQERGQMPVAEAVGFVLQACSAMYEAHALGIVHRDLKPSNLFVCSASDGGRVVKVLDFGIVKIDGGENTMTRAETVLGTPAYMSPEQIRSAKEVDGRSDVWSLGVILYELLASELPFDGASAPVMSNAILNASPKPLRPRRMDAPDGLVDALARALEKDPEQRWGDVRTFAEAIAPFGPPPGVWTAPPLPARATRPSGTLRSRGSERAVELSDSLSLAQAVAPSSVPRSRMPPAIARPSPDLWRTASSPRLTPAVSLGGLALLAAVGVLAFVLGRGSAGSVEPQPHVDDPVGRLDAASDAGSKATTTSP